MGWIRTYAQRLWFTGFDHRPWDPRTGPRPSCPDVHVLAILDKFLCVLVVVPGTCILYMGQMVSSLLGWQ
eukprot:SAG22_NODE_13905_length_391_cov_0.712329_1_plen_70_part_00